MKLLSLLGLGFCCLVSQLEAQDPVLYNFLPTRPVFTLQQQSINVSRSLAPGQRLQLPPTTFSGLGNRRIPLIADGLYYLANFGAGSDLYWLAPQQTLVVNDSGRVLTVRVVKQHPFEGRLATGNFLMIEATAPTQLEWSTDQGGVQHAPLIPGRIYHLVWASPTSGLGSGPQLEAWDYRE